MQPESAVPNSESRWLLKAGRDFFVHDVPFDFGLNPPLVADDAFQASPYFFNKIRQCDRGGGKRHVGPIALFSLRILHKVIPFAPLLSFLP